MTGHHESSREIESLVRQAGTIYAGAARWPSAAPLPAAEYTVDSVDNVYFTNTSPIANVNNVYRSIPMMLINTESEENRYIFSVDGGISPNSDVARRATGFTFGSNTSPTLSRQRSRENSSSCSIGDPLDGSFQECITPDAREPTNFHTSTIYVSRARLEHLEDLERNFSRIVADGLMEYIYSENMTQVEETLQTSPHESDNDTALR